MAPADKMASSEGYLTKEHLAGFDSYKVKQDNDLGAC